MCRTLRLPTIAAVAVAIAMLCGTARAGGMTDCDTPFVFEGTAANIVPVQYEAAAPPGDARLRRRLVETAQRLAWLVKLDSWHAPTYGSLGVVAHLSLSQPCRAERVLDALLNRAGFASQPIRVGQAVVMLSGRVYQEGEQIFLQSTLLGFRRNERDGHGAPSPESLFAPEGLTLPLPSSGGLGLAAALPLDGITFPPRRVTLGELDEIEKLFAGASRLYERPAKTARSRPLEFRPGEPLAFSVRLTRDAGWIEIESQFTGEHGFIRVEPGVERLLHAKMPELDFLNGLLGYLRLRQPRDFDPAPSGSRNRVEAAFARYRENPETRDEPEGHALAEAILGVLAADGADGAAAWTAARQRFEVAVTLAPYEGDYQNLLAVAQTWFCCVARPTPTGAPPGVDPTERLIESLSLDPRDGTALANLDNLFSFLRRREAAGEAPPGVDTGDLAARQERVRRVRAALQQ